MVRETFREPTPPPQRNPSLIQPLIYPASATSFYRGKAW